MAKIPRFQLYNDDRTGFTKKKVGLVKDGRWRVDGSELDMPPPSTKSLGGEGEIAQGALNPSDGFAITDLATAASLDNPVVAVTAAGGIQPSFVHPWMYVVGSNANVIVSANPQIAAGVEGDILGLVGAGSSVTLANGNGLSLVAGRPYRIDSGSILVLMYHTGASAAWYETSRTVP